MVTTSAIWPLSIMSAYVPSGTSTLDPAVITSLLPWFKPLEFCLYARLTRMFWPNESVLNDSRYWSFNSEFIESEIVPAMLLINPIVCCFPVHDACEPYDSSISLEYGFVYKACLGRL